MRHLTEQHKRKIGEKVRLNNLKLGLKPPSNLGKKFTLAHRNKISKALTGIKRPEWTLERRQAKSDNMKLISKHSNTKNRGKTIRKSLQYVLWRKAIFERDNYTCTECGLRSGLGKAVELHPDHIKPFAYFPELRFELSNGRTLCVDCHRKTDTYGIKAQRMYGRMGIWQ